VDPSGRTAGLHRRWVTLIDNRVERRAEGMSKVTCVEGEGFCVIAGALKRKEEFGRMRPA
jgi:hypothetical protein